MPTAKTAKTSSGAREPVERAIAFERDCLVQAAGHSEQHPLGLWTRCAEHRKMWMLNQLHVTGRHSGLTAKDLMAELDRGLADVTHRFTTIADDATGRAMADDFRTAGWRVGPTLVMLLDREPPERPPPAIAREIDEQAMYALDAAILAEDDEMPAADRPVVVAGHAHVRAAVPGARMFAGFRDGVPASQTTLFTDRRTGQAENVATLSAHRGHGLAAATVGLAAREAVAAGCDLVFIVVHADTGPVPLYAGIGFRAAGRYWSFVKPGE